MVIEEILALGRQEYLIMVLEADGNPVQGCSWGRERVMRRGDADNIHYVVGLLVEEAVADDEPVAIHSIAVGEQQDEHQQDKRGKYCEDPRPRCATSQGYNDGYCETDDDNGDEPGVDLRGICDWIGLCHIVLLEVRG